MKKSDLRYDIFISYRRSSAKGIARSIKEALNAQGLSVFLDLDELKDGHFMDVIYSALNNSKIFMIILSEDIFERCSDEDDCVRKEIEYALEKRMHVIPVNPDKQFKGFPEDLPPTLRDNINQHQFSAIDTDQLFSASIEKMVQERIAPTLKANKKTSSSNKKKFVFIVVLLILMLVLAACVKFYQKKSLYDKDPIVQIDKADARSTVPIYEQNSVASEKKQVVNSYRDAAIRCDHEGNTRVLQYGGGNTSAVLKHITDTEYYFQAAGYAWSRIEEYDKSITSFMSAIRVLNIILKDFPEEQGYVIDHKGFYLNNLAYSYFYNGMIEDAFNSIDEAIQLKPEILNYHDSKGELYYLAGRYVDALEEWEYIYSQDKYYEKNDWVDKSLSKIESR